MLSLEDAAAIKVAVEICNSSQLKKEILRVPDSEYEVNKTHEIQPRQKLWNELIERKAGIILENLCVPKTLQEKVIGTVLSVGRRVLTWAEYSENTIGFSRKYSYNFLNSSFFTTRGIVNCKKAAEKLMDDVNLSIKQKYKLALYCMNEHIPTYCNQMTETDKQDLDNYDSQYPDFVVFWSYYLRHEVHELSGDIDPNLYWLQMAVESGSKDAVEYCLGQTNWIRDEDALVYAAQEAVRNYVKALDDNTVFSDDYRSDTWREFWIPHQYYSDILYFLFLKMRQDTQIVFLKEDIKGQDYDEDPIFERPYRSRVLEIFLDWPYHDYFLKTVRLMWDFLPEKSYVDLIVRFTCKIGYKGDFKYGEEKIFDYRELLLKFLKEIPEHNKRYVFRDYEFDSEYGGTEIENASSILISHLFKLEDYTYQDKRIIEWIFSNATNEEKENIISSVYGKQICFRLMKAKRWTLLNEFVSNCYTSEEKVEKFIRCLSLTEDARRICIDFFINDEQNAVETFIKWSTLPDVRINQLKELMIYSDYGRNACLNIISHDRKLAAVDKVIRWCFLTEEKASAFKKELIFCSEGMQKCANLVTANEEELANEFTKWSLSSNEDIIQYKKHVAKKIGIYVCKRLISDIKVEHIVYNRVVDHTIQFKGGRWEDVENFLTWCFSSEDEINDFKKTLTMKDADGTRNLLMSLHLNLMYATKWEEAETLYSWLGLSVEEIQKLKKEAIFYEGCMKHIYLLTQNTELANFLEYREVKWDNINLLLRFCLANEDDVLEFKNRFDEVYGFKMHSNTGAEIFEDKKKNLNKFYSLIEALRYEFCKPSEKKFTNCFQESM